MNYIIIKNPMYPSEKNVRPLHVYIEHEDFCSFDGRRNLAGLCILIGKKVKVHKNSLNDLLERVTKRLDRLGIEYHLI